MAGIVRQHTKVGYNSQTKVTNTYPRKRGTLRVPRNATIKFEKGFERTDLKERIARLKSSPAYKNGEAKARSQLQTVHLKRNQTLNLRNKNLNVKVNTS